MSARKVAPSGVDVFLHLADIGFGVRLQKKSAQLVAREIRALRSVARAAERAHAFCPTFETCPTCRALARLRKAPGSRKRPICPQCGNGYGARACGPGHAMKAAEVKRGSRKRTGGRRG